MKIFDKIDHFFEELSWISLMVIVLILAIIFLPIYLFMHWIGEEI